MKRIGGFPITIWLKCNIKVGMFLRPCHSLIIFCRICSILFAKINTYCLSNSTRNSLKNLGFDGLNPEMYSTFPYYARLRRYL